MSFSMRLNRESDGSFSALCPELGLLANGTDRKEAADRLTTLIMEWLERRQAVEAEREPGLPRSANFAFSVFPLCKGDEVKLLFLPHDPMVN
jgi:predicted RNase H-like HicB family nuclease